MRFRLVYSTQAELAAEVKQMAHGGVLVRDPAAARLAFDTPVVLELVMPDGTTLLSGGKVLQALAGLGVAVTVEPHVVEQARLLVDSAAPVGPPTSRPIATRIPTPTSTPIPTRTLTPTSTPSPTRTLTPTSTPIPTRTLTPTSTPIPTRTLTPTSTPIPTRTSTPPSTPPLAGAAEPNDDVPRGEPELTRAQKIQLALHGTRDQRNAMLRDRDRGLHAFVLKNPGITIDDILAIAKNPMVGTEMYKQISERAEWFQRPAIALALARNHKVPGEIAVRALAHVAPDALRQLAKGTGAPPHVVTAARKRVIGK